MRRLTRVLDSAGEKGAAETYPAHVSGWRDGSEEADPGSDFDSPFFLLEPRGVEVLHAHNIVMNLILIL